MIIYKRWVTNCTAEDAFEQLMKTCANDPDGCYTIGPPHEPVSLCRGTKLVYHVGNRSYSVPSRGLTVDELEKMDYRAIYECF
jgi:hypothetical protein